MKLRFKGKVNFMEYHSHLVDFVDGEVKEVPDNVGEYLLSDFRDCFEEVKTREIEAPPKDRMMRKTKTRKL